MYKLIRCLMVYSLTLSFLPAVYALTMEEAIDGMRPFTGEHVPGVDTTTLTGKVMCGYQGWFAAEGDDIGRGWVHYGGRNFGPGRCTIDMWPDMTDLDKDEKYPTPFKHADGSTAYLYSPGNRKTVDTLVDFIDIDVSQILLRGETLDQAGSRILEDSLHIASGKKTKAEAIGYVGSTAIYQTGPVV